MFNFLLLPVDVQLSSHPLLKDDSFSMKWSWHSCQGRSQLTMDAWIYCWTHSSVPRCLCLCRIFDKYLCELRTFWSLISTWSVVELAQASYLSPGLGKRLTSPLRREDLKRNTYLIRRCRTLIPRVYLETN